MVTDRSSDDLAALRIVAAEFEAVCGSLSASDWNRPTPCTQWNLQALVEHVVGGNRFTVSVLDGSTAQAALRTARDSFAELQTDAAVAIASLWEMVRAFQEPGALVRECHHLDRDLTGDQVLRLRLHDLIIHTWDIGQAVRPPAVISPTLVRWGVEELAAPDSRAAEHFGVSACRPSAAAYLAAFGRSIE